MKGFVAHVPLAPNRTVPSRTHRRALFHGDLVVARHPHRQLRRRMPGRGPASRAPRARRRTPAQRPLLGVERRHRHHAASRAAREAARAAPPPRARRRAGSPPSISSPTTFTCTSTSTGVPRARRTVHRIREPRAVQRMQELEAADLLHLVPLQMADRVPSHRHRHRIHFRQRLLHPVFAHVVQSCLLRRFHGVRVRASWSPRRWSPAARARPVRPLHRSGPAPQPLARRGPGKA